MNLKSNTVRNSLSQQAHDAFAVTEAGFSRGVQERRGVYMARPSCPMCGETGAKVEMIKKKLWRCHTCGVEFNPKSGKVLWEGDWLYPEEVKRAREASTKSPSTVLSASPEELPEPLAIPQKNIRVLGAFIVSQFIVNPSMSLIKSKTGFSDEWLITLGVFAAILLICVQLVYKAWTDLSKRIRSEGFIHVKKTAAKLMERYFYPLCFAGVMVLVLWVVFLTTENNNLGAARYLQINSLTPDDDVKGKEPIFVNISVTDGGSADDGALTWGWQKISYKLYLVADKETPAKHSGEVCAFFFARIGSEQKIKLIDGFDFPTGSTYKVEVYINDGGKPHATLSLPTAKQ